MSLAISVTTVVKTPSTDSKAAYKLLSSLVLSFFSLSLAENALVTGLIITKILRVTTYRQGDISPRLVGYASRLSRDIVRILIESGMITFMAQLVQILVYNFDNNAFLIIGGLVGQLFVRGFHWQSHVDLLMVLIISIRLCRGFRRQSSLCVSRWALPTISIIKYPLAIIQS